MVLPKELLPSDSIDALEGEHKVHLLNDNARRKTKSIGSLTGLTDLGFQIMEVEPGHEYSEYHRHLYEEQCFYVLSGSGTAVIEETEYPISSGDFIGFPKNGVAHTIVNSGEEPLKFICARVNLEQDVCDYPRQKKRLYMNGAEESLVDFESIRIED